MAKAINWPLQFRDEVIAEGCDTEHCALRLGTLYYENRFWVPDEVVDIRVNHKKIRKGVVVDEMRQLPLGQLQEADFRRLKSTLKSQASVIDFLNQTYNQPVDAATLVTVVTYRNLPLDPEAMEVEDDPHM